MTPAGRQLLLLNAKQVVTCAGAPRARRGGEMNDVGVLPNAGVAIQDGRIAWVGSRGELERAFPDADHYDCGGRLLTPGLVDSHTHAVFGRPRFAEQEMRAGGLDYMEIARQGGGIHSSVRDLRLHTEDALVELARPRLAALASHGTTTIEVKSGYGLSAEAELRTLRVVRRLAAELPMRIVPTWLGAHEIPVEYRERPQGREDYIALLLEDMLPAVSRDRLASFADVFCERGVYSVDESRRILAAARAAGLGLKLHADELSSSGGAELAAEMRATSADHLVSVSDAGIQALAAAGTVATLLPGTMIFLGKSGHAPARKMIEAGVAVALATDFNPGTSPTVNFPLILTFGVSQLRMSAAEALVAATVNGAAALGLAGETGQIAPGFSADLSLFDAEDYRELPYWYGARLCHASWARGKPCYP